MKSVFRFYIGNMTIARFVRIFNDTRHRVSCKYFYQRVNRHICPMTKRKSLFMFTSNNSVFCCYCCYDSILISYVFTIFVHRSVIRQDGAVFCRSCEFLITPDLVSKTIRKGGGGTKNILNCCSDIKTLEKISSLKFFLFTLYESSLIQYSLVVRRKVQWRHLICCDNELSHFLIKSSLDV
jgi:hypothetical protein